MITIHNDPMVSSPRCPRPRRCAQKELYPETEVGCEMGSSESCAGFGEASRLQRQFFCVAPCWIVPPTPIQDSSVEESPSSISTKIQSRIDVSDRCNHVDFYLCQTPKRTQYEHNGPNGFWFGKPNLPTRARPGPRPGPQGPRPSRRAA